MADMSRHVQHWPIYGRYMADKHSIAQLLSQHAERWNSPAEIKTEIADVPDRTLRRWLGELVHEGVIERSGAARGHAIVGNRLQRKNSDSRPCRPVLMRAVPRRRSNPSFRPRASNS